MNRDITTQRIRASEAALTLYRGCYFTYVVDDPQWLTAMGLAYNAAVALAAGPRLDAAVRAATLAAWADLTGR